MQNKGKKIAIFLTVVLLLAVSFYIVKIYIYPGMDKKEVSVSKSDAKDKTTAKDGTSSSIDNTNSTTTEKDNSTTPKDSTAPPKDNTANGAVTSLQATEIISKLVLKDHPAAKTRYDHDQDRDGKKYYVLQLYDAMPDHTATIGWYYVQVDNGKAFEWDLISDKLIPLN
ncbi:MAG TPA: hypothetical protein VIK72_12055 [Clostridiaceae bacterium]